MTPLEEVHQALYAKRPHVMVWEDSAGRQQNIRFYHEAGAKRSCRIHNHNAELGTLARYMFDPEGERFPRDD